MLISKILAKTIKFNLKKISIHKFSDYMVIHNTQKRKICENGLQNCLKTFLVIKINDLDS